MARSVRIVFQTILIAGCCVVGSCSLIDVRKEVRYDHRGRLLTDSLLQQIQVNVTTSNWVEENLGLPSRIVKENDELEHWVYQFHEQQYRRTRVLLIFSYRSTTIVPREISVTIMDKTVTAVKKNSKKMLEPLYEREVRNQSNSALFPRVKSPSMVSTVA